MRRWALLILAMVLVSPLCGTEPQVVPLGTQVTWKDLPGVDGKKHSLDDLKDRQVVVVAVTCNHCPVALEYHTRIKAFVAAQDSRVALVAVSVSDLETDKLPRMEQIARRQGFNFPYLYDETQSLGRRLGATITPQFFVLDSQRRIVYRGAWDDHSNRASVKEHYVEEAVRSVLSGKSPARPETDARGCSISYRD